MPCLGGYLLFKNYLKWIPVRVNVATCDCRWACPGDSSRLCTAMAEEREEVRDLMKNVNIKDIIFSIVIFKRLLFDVLEQWFSTSEK